MFCTPLPFQYYSTTFSPQDSRWKVIEEEKPDLFEEAISVVAGEKCDKHTECLKKAGNRYECEKAEKMAMEGAKSKQGARRKSHQI